MQVLGQLSRLTAARFTDNDDDRILADDRQQLLADGESRKVLPLLQDRLLLGKVTCGTIGIAHVFSEPLARLVIRFTFSG